MIRVDGPDVAPVHASADLATHASRRCAQHTNHACAGKEIVEKSMLKASDRS
jgi:hypothetical protein